HGRAFVPGASGVEVFSACTLTLEHPDSHRRQSFACEVVMVLAQVDASGVGLQFADHGDAERQRLRAFVEDGLIDGTAPLRAPLATPFDDEAATGLKTRPGDDPAPPPPPAEEDAFGDLDEETNPFGGGIDGSDDPQRRAVVSAR